MFIVAWYRYSVILANSRYVKPCFVLGECFESFTTNVPKCAYGPLKRSKWMNVIIKFFQKEK